jgi:hypothetical protein
MFYLPHMVLGNGGGALEAVRTTPMVATLDGVTPANLINNPFPQGILPAANDRNPQANVGASITAPEHYFHNGYAQTWSMEIQREIPWGIVVDAHYWGNKGTRLMADGGSSLNTETIGWNIDQIPVQDLALGSHLNDLVPNPFFGLISAGALSGPQISRQQALLPFPQYTSVLQVYQPAGDSTYEAVTIQGEKRLSATFTFLAAYTRSKAIDDVRAPLNSYDLSQEKGLSTFDAPNHFQLSLVYSVPFGRGRAYGKSLNPYLNAIIGNWDVNSIVMLQSGFPISIARPSVNIGQSAKLSDPTINEWFNKSVFTVAAPFTYGNVGPVLPDVRSDWTRNIDGVLVKNLDFGVRDRKITAQFRFEVFNVFNTPQFAAPSATAAVTAGTFALVTSTANSPRNLQMGLKFIF